ncbi:MAG: (d)CMP kinase [Candidatus Actinomarina sp.]|uniref:(d)CMP kinase n=1 Tax=Candidatus Actinomarina minuta TaxID=1389454 RepID=S5DV30_9ACTN|nr:cytidylate kinase [Candidatus Actinomarina minuta]
MEKFILTIDGPSGVGKTSIGKLLADILNCNFFSSGNVYRSLAMFINKNINNNYEKYDIDIVDGICYVNKETYSSEDLYSNEVTITSSKIAKEEKIRNYVKESLLKYYQSLDKSLIIEGRDMGSVVFQNAKYKIYLDADLITRGKRREDQSKMNETITDLKKRDLEDSNRLISPLIVPDGALVINNTDLTLQQTINLIIEKLKLQ